MMFTSTEKKILKRLGHMTEIDPKTRKGLRRLIKLQRRGEMLIVDARRLTALLRALSNQDYSSVVRVSNVETQTQSDTTMITINRLRFVGSANPAMSNGTS